MPMVPVHITDMGAAAIAGAARFNRDGTAVILIHADLPVEEQAAMLALLLHEGGEQAQPLFPPLAATG